MTDDQAVPRPATWDGPPGQPCPCPNLAGDCDGTHVTGDQAVPLPPDADAITAADTGDGVVIISCGEVPGLTLPVSTEAYRQFTDILRAQGAATERRRIRKAILARAIQCRTCGKPHLGYLQPGADGHPYEARFASPSSSLLERLADLLDGTP